MMNESNFNPENDGEGKADPFIQEIHTGERVLADVNEDLSKQSEHLESSTAIHMKRAKETSEVWKNMLERLTPQEQAAFKHVMAEGLENFYYTHYNALRRRLQLQGKFKD